MRLKKESPLNETEQSPLHLCNRAMCLQLSETLGQTLGSAHQEAEVATAAAVCFFLTAWGTETTS